MAQEIRAAHVTIPAGTPIAAPVTVDVSFPERLVRSVRWRVPPGPSGQMGWRLSSDGVAVVPVVPGSWVIADGEADDWALDGYLDSGNWQVTGYNTGVYPHTVHLTFLLDPVSQQAAAPVLVAGQPAQLAALVGSVDLSGG